MLLTGGIRTNIFKQGPDEIVVILNDDESLRLAKEFFMNLDEIEDVIIGEN